MVVKLLSHKTVFKQLVLILIVYSLKTIWQTQLQMIFACLVKQFLSAKLFAFLSVNEEASRSL